MDYVGGESNLIRVSEESAFTYQVPPCCCLAFAQKSPITKQKLRVIRLMFLQFPIVQLLIYMFYILRIIEAPELNKLFFMPVMGVSIVLIIWGINMYIRLVAPVVPNHSIKGKYAMIQLVLLLCKVQPIIGDFVYQFTATLQDIKVNYPMSVEAYKNGNLVNLKMGFILKWKMFFPFSYYRNDNSSSDDDAINWRPEILQLPEHGVGDNENNSASVTLTDKRNQNTKGHIK